MDVASIAAENCHLHIWTTSSFLRETFAVMDAWGFDYRSSFVWVKPKLGLGNYWRIAHEFLLYAVRGKAAFQRRDVRSWLELKATKHSEKPHAIRELI